MADFDKISINGTYYNVKDSALTAAVNALTTEVGEVQETVTQQGQTIQQQGQTIQQNKTDTDKKIAELTTQFASLSKLPTVKDYGAKGDGTADDTEAINQALAEVGCAIFPPGTYKISSSIELANNQDIFGFGPKASKIITTGNFDAIVATGCINSTIFGIGIDGRNTTNTGIRVNNSASVACVLCEVSKCQGYGIRYEGSYDAVSPTHKIFGCFCSLNGLDGYSLNATDCSMDCCSGVSNGQVNQDSSNLSVFFAAKITNCHFFNVNDSFGYKRCGTSVSLNGPDIQVSCCHIEGGKNNCLTIGANAVRLLMSNCLIYASFGDSLVWCGCWGAHFSNVTFLGQATDDVPKPAFVQTLAGNPQDLWIDNCYFSDVVSTSNLGGSLIIAVCSKNFSTAFPAISKASCRGYVKCDGTFTDLGA